MAPCHQIYKMFSYCEFHAFKVVLGLFGVLGFIMSIYST
jgi:hypothetical protein